MLPGGLFGTKYASDLAIIRTKTQWFLLAVLLVVFIIIVPMMSTDYWLTQFTHIAITIIVVLGLHILAGLCGLISIGQAGFVCVGAFTTAILVSHWDFNGWLCLPIAALAGGLAGLFFGLPSFRLKMFYLAISTLAAYWIIIWAFKYRDISDVTGGFTGLDLSAHPLTLGGIDFSEDVNLYILAVILVVIGTFIAKNIQRSNTGRKFVAIRDNELAAEVSGVNLFKNKLLAFFIGCAFAGVAGWLWAYSQQRVTPSDFTLMDGIWYMGMIVIGGWGSTVGVFLGAFMLDFLGIMISDNLAPWIVDFVPDRWGAQMYVVLKLVLGGLGMVMFMKFVPNGLAGVWQKAKLSYRLYPYSSTES
ncbi:MAG: branched-chain amino acid ABC transporter permease [Dehalococcoidia bacterium]